MNTINNNTNNTAKNQTKGEKSMLKEVLSEKKAFLFISAIFIAVGVLCLFLPPVFQCIYISAFLAVGCTRSVAYLAETKTNKLKRSFMRLNESVYTQEDFENFRETLTEELYKEMKNNAYVEISTEKEELEKERRKMKTFLRKHNTRSVVFEKFEEDILVDVGLFLSECFPDDLYENNTLKDFVNFFDENKEDFISSIQHVVHADCCMLNKMIEGLAYYCLDKKDLRELRKKLHKAYYNENCSGIMLYEYRNEEEQLAGENEATFRC